MTEQWEYKIIKVKGTSDDEAELDRLGDEGWELVAVTSESEDYDSVAYLKRKIKL